MPKIEVYADALFGYIGKKYSPAELEEILPAAKAELDGVNEEEGILKIELNDTNRPDLWSTAGLGRQLRVNGGGARPEYDFFSDNSLQKETGGRSVVVDPELKNIRPYIAAFAIEGKAIDESTLMDLIQTQEKLCWNYGRKRSSIAMGVYRSSMIKYPVKYTAADPEKTSFTPLQMDDREYSLKEIIEKHPKGHEFGHIVADFPKFPFITDSNNDVLSFPPVINSAEIGAVKTGDEQLFIEMTGTDLDSLLHAASIVACDLADSGCRILPVKVVYPYDTAYGKEIVCPYYFQQPIEVKRQYAVKLLGEDLSAEEMSSALSSMGCRTEIVSTPPREEVIRLNVPEYRNDFLHPVDIIEDIMIGRGMEKFEPVMPDDFTVGRLLPEEEFARNVKEIMVGLGYQEMMYNYLGSGKDYIERMEIKGADHIQIANPMTENYEYVRASIIPELLKSESVSGNAVYPHAIFESGKVAFLDDSDNSGTVTRNYISFLSADRTADFNQVNSHVSALYFYLTKEYELREKDDPRFIPGRCAEVFVSGVRTGIFGEIHPAVLENWGIDVPCTAAEVDLDLLLR